MSKLTARIDDKPRGRRGNKTPHMKCGFKGKDWHVLLPRPNQSRDIDRKWKSIRERNPAEKTAEERDRKKTLPFNGLDHDFVLLLIDGLLGPCYLWVSTRQHDFPSSILPLIGKKAL